MSDSYLNIDSPETGLARLKREIILAGLCCGCGTCVGVCPTDALQIPEGDSYFPIIDEQRCIGCGECYEVCPGKGYPVTQWSRETSDADTEFYPLRGPVRKYLIGFSTDEAIRAESASGGIATGLLLHLLKTKSVDQVLVVSMKGGRPQAKFTDDQNDVREALQSKYGPVPTMSLIKEIKDNPREIAIVATPCQLAGWKAAAQRIPILKECLKLSIGLFCGQVQSYDSLKAIAMTLGCDYPEHAEFIGWRCGAYPGSERFHTDQGAILDKPLYQWLDVAVPYFNLQRCILCPDGANWLADMTLGDIHSGGYDETVIVCRTKRAEEVLSAAKESGEIFYKKMEMADVERCVISGITRSKLLPALYRNRLRVRKGLLVPQFDYEQRLLADIPIFRGILFRVHYAIWNYIRKGWRPEFFLSHPWLMEKVGHFVYCFPVSLPGWKPIRRIIKYILKRN
jgi:coenzyme F420 hydrogenase subunit beta